MYLRLPFIMRQRRARQALAGLFLADPERRWTYVSLVRVCGIGGITLSSVLAVWDAHGWIESEYLPAPQEHRRGYRPTEAGWFGMKRMLTEADWTGPELPVIPAERG